MIAPDQLLICGLSRPAATLAAMEGVSFCNNGRANATLSTAEQVSAAEQWPPGSSLNIATSVQKLYTVIDHDGCQERRVCGRQDYMLGILDPKRSVE